MSDQSQTATNKQSESALCVKGCGFFVSTQQPIGGDDQRTTKRENAGYEVEEEARRTRTPTLG